VLLLVLSVLTFSLCAWRFLSGFFSLRDWTWRRFFAGTTSFLTFVAMGSNLVLMISSTIRVNGWHHQNVLRDVLVPSSLVVFETTTHSSCLSVSILWVQFFCKETKWMSKKNTVKLSKRILLFALCFNLIVLCLLSVRQRYNVVSCIDGTLAAIVAVAFLWGSARIRKKLQTSKNLAAVYIDAAQILEEAGNEEKHELEENHDVDVSNVRPSPSGIDTAADQRKVWRGMNVQLTSEVARTIMKMAQTIAWSIFMHCAALVLELTETPTFPFITHVCELMFVVTLSIINLCILNYLEVSRRFRYVAFRERHEIKRKRNIRQSKSQPEFHCSIVFRSTNDKTAETENPHKKKKVRFGIQDKDHRYRNRQNFANV